MKSHTPHAPPVQDASGAQRGANLALTWHDAAAGSVHLLGRLAAAAEALGLDLTTFKGEWQRRREVCVCSICSAPGGWGLGRANAGTQYTRPTEHMLLPLPPVLPLQLGSPGPKACLCSCSCGCCLRRPPRRRAVQRGARWQSRRQQRRRRLQAPTGWT
jgi:hypothetical protein